MNPQQDGFSSLLEASEGFRIRGKSCNLLQTTKKTIYIYISKSRRLFGWFSASRFKQFTESHVEDLMKVIQMDQQNCVILMDLVQQHFLSDFQKRSGSLSLSRLLARPVARFCPRLWPMRQLHSWAKEVAEKCPGRSWETRRGKNGEWQEEGFSKFSRFQSFCFCF